jgi:HEAT repeat protein
VPPAAASALGHLGGTRATSALAHALFDADLLLREAAARALVELRTAASADAVWLPLPASADAVDVYLRVLMAAEGAGAVQVSDLRPLAVTLRAAAAEALEGPVERTVAVLRMLERDETELAAGMEPAAEWPPASRQAARGVLAEVAQGLVPELVAVAGHPEPGVREQGLRILGQVDHPEVATALRAALADKDSQVLRAALTSLDAPHARSAEGLPGQVARLLEHSEWSVRMEAAQALGRLGDRATVEALRRALAHDRFAFVREAAARALGQLGGPAAVEALRRAGAADSEPRVRQAAAEALSAPRAN